MPLIEQSTYHPPFLLSNRHLQTIIPSYFRPSEDVNYEREFFHTPDDDVLFLDWARVGSDKLVVLHHGLCGHSRRHYVVSLVTAFNKAGWDCLCWNYRGTGPSDGGKLHFTTNNSTNEVGWVVEHAIAQGRYRKVGLTGYSMGGNLVTLYLCREAARVPSEVVGGVVFCATIDLNSSSHLFNSAIGRIYANHFIKQFKEMIIRKHALFPDQIDLAPLEKVNSFTSFDHYYTAPLFGFADEDDYYRTASACNYLSALRLPLLMINPSNDPFLAERCYPVEEAKRNPNLYLEIPEGGGHCGFITFDSKAEWWPARRSKEFLLPLAD
ncbi:MAG: alpha/beta fold hydrolase [Victivallales bacterium]|nr:alpha/beta fold hydrolase [Victivallales bacterium]